MGSRIFAGPTPSGLRSPPVIQMVPPMAPSIIKPNVAVARSTRGTEMPTTTRATAPRAKTITATAAYVISLPRANGAYKSFCIVLPNVEVNRTNEGATPAPQEA